MHQTYVTVHGNLTADPQVIDSRNGRFVRFTVASTPRLRDPHSGEYRDGVTTFYSVTANRALGRNVAQSLRKGQPVVVSGRLSVDSYTTSDGEHRQSVALAAELVGHDLNFGTSSFAKPERARQVETDAAPEREGEAA